MAVDVDIDVKAKNRLERYAELAVRVGANVEEGQTVFINAQIEHAPLARALTRAAYAAARGTSTSTTATSTCARR